MLTTIHSLTGIFGVANQSSSNGPDGFVGDDDTLIIIVKTREREKLSNIK
jgi:hypothetical protein